MTRKDYVLIAEALKRARSETPERNHAGLDVAASQLSASLAADNPRFDRERFLRAAGVQS